jgi:hypothetical protein
MRGSSVALFIAFVARVIGLGRGVGRIRVGDVLTPVLIVDPPAACAAATTLVAVGLFGAALFAAFFATTALSRTLAERWPRGAPETSARSTAWTSTEASRARAAEASAATRTRAAEASAATGTRAAKSTTATAAARRAETVHAGPRSIAGWAAAERRSRACAGTTRSTARLAITRLVDDHRAALDGPTVQRLDRGESVCVRGHLHEPEASRLSRDAIGDQPHVDDLAILLLEQRP